MGCDYYVITALKVTYGSDASRQSHSYFDVGGSEEEEAAVKAPQGAAPKTCWIELNRQQGYDIWEDPSDSDSDGAVSRAKERVAAARDRHEGADKVVYEAGAWTISAEHKMEGYKRAVSARCVWDTVTRVVKVVYTQRR